MCQSCAGEYVVEDGDGTWPPLTPLMRSVVDAIEELYKLPGGSVGGPLHVVTDDSNVEDENLLFCLPDCVRTTTKKWGVNGIIVAPYTEEVRNLSLGILWGLSSMSTPERAVTVVLDMFGEYPPRQAPCEYAGGCEE